jgi:hypothetical protein
MNIDERLEALAVRHEALTRSMELTHHDIQDLLKTTKEQTQQIQDLLKTSLQDGENIRALARIAEAHQQRIEDLEDNRQ